MFELCDNLIGIYKTYNNTKTITIDPRIYGKQQTALENNNIRIVHGDQQNAENANINEEKEKEGNAEKNPANDNLESSESTIPESSSNLTGSSNINDSEDMDMFSAESQNQNDRGIEPLFAPEEMEVDS